VGRDNLEVFISGNETELKNERASVRRLVKSLGFGVTSSEERPASNTPIGKKYTQEVKESDIYVGIFGQDESDHSINEFKIATDNLKDRLIFVKKVKGERNTKIAKFLEEIKDSDSGVYYREFEDVIDLDVQVQKALVSTVSENFRKSKTGGGEMVITQVSTEPFTLATGKILKFDIPPVLIRGKEHGVEVKITGNGKYLFLTLMLANPDKEQTWWVDTKTIDLALDGGKMELANDEYNNSWSFPIYPNAKIGEYIAFLGLYQDTYDLPTVNRRLVDFIQKKIQVI